MNSSDIKLEECVGVSVIEIAVDNQACGSCFKCVDKQQSAPCGYWKLIQLRRKSFTGDN